MNLSVVKYALILLLGVFISSVSQVILKKSAIKGHGNYLKEYLNLRVVIAYGMFVLTTLLSIYAYKGISLSMGPILEATSYIYITIFGIRIFHEKISRNKICALGLIIMGILIYSFCG